MAGRRLILRLKTCSTLLNRGDQRGAGPEGGNASWGDGMILPCFRISARSLGFVAQMKHPEVGDPHILASFQSLAHPNQDAVDNHRRLVL